MTIESIDVAIRVALAGDSGSTVHCRTEPFIRASLNSGHNDVSGLDKGHVKDSLFHAAVSGVIIGRGQTYKDRLSLSVNSLLLYDCVGASLCGIVALLVVYLAIVIVHVIGTGRRHASVHSFITVLANTIPLIDTHIGPLNNLAHSFIKARAFNHSWYRGNLSHYRLGRLTYRGLLRGTDSRRWSTSTVRFGPTIVLIGVIGSGRIVFHNATSLYIYLVENEHEHFTGYESLWILVRDYLSCGHSLHGIFGVITSSEIGPLGEIYFHHFVELVLVHIC